MEGKGEWSADLLCCSRNARRSGRSFRAALYCARLFHPPTHLARRDVPLTQASTFLSCAFCEYGRTLSLCIPVRVFSSSAHPLSRRDGKDPNRAHRGTTFGSGASASEGGPSRPFFFCFRACSSFLREGGLFGLLLRASNEGLPIPFTSLKGSGQGCPLLRASNEHILIVRVLRARGAPGRSLPSLDCPFPRLL